MKIEIPMPKMGESIMEGTIIKWYKKPGDTVKKDETIFEISTDKVDTEVPSPVEGILVEILFNEGDTIEVGKTVAFIDDEPGSVRAAKLTPQKETPTKVEEKKIEIIAAEPIQNNSVKNIPETSIDIPMPKMGESVMEGTIIKWYKKVGDKVKKDETIFEISTDKVDTEVPSPNEGILTEILVNEQETVAVGVIVARLSTSDTHAVHLAEISTQHIVDLKTDAMHDMIAKQTLLDEPKEISMESTSESKVSNRFYSPLVMNIAKSEKVSFEELEKIDGSGLEGRVTKNDILNYLLKRNKAQKEIQPQVKEVIPVAAKVTEKLFTPQKFEPAYSSGLVERIPMDNIRQKIMQHMIKSRDTSVHVTALIEVDVSKIYNFIQKNKDTFLKNEGVKLTYMSFVSHAVVKALKEFPLVNSVIEGTTILQKRFVNLGVAVALEPNGLIVPNIKNAHEKNIIGIAKSINDLAERARTKKLIPDDITGGTFTITNYGVFGTLFGTPIINQPEVAILGVGAVIKRPVVVEIDGTDSIAIKPLMYLSLAHDHRVIDGMVGGRFLKFIKDQLENFSGIN